MYECVGGRGNTRTQDIRERGGCVTTGRRRREEACLFSLSEVWMQQHREVGGKSERNSWYFKRNLWAPTCFTLILFLSLFRSNKLSLEVERKSFCLKKCLILESTHTWRELFQILKVCYVFFCIFSIPSVRHFHWLKANIDQCLYPGGVNVHCAYLSFKYVFVGGGTCACIFFF